MTVAEIKELSVEDKVRLMEAIWLDLRAHAAAAAVPEAHRRLLDERRARVESGEAKLLDWDEVKGTIGSP